MNRLPWPASAILQGFGVDSAVIGDLEESCCSGRSRFWCWRQVAGILLFGSTPSFVLGSLTLLLILMLFTMAAAGPLLIMARQTGQWPLSHVAWVVGGYACFAVSAWHVTRFHRRPAGSALILRAATIALAIVIAIIAFELRGVVSVIAERAQ
jgi:hypothetical protein